MKHIIVWYCFVVGGKKKPLKAPKKVKNEDDEVGDNLKLWRGPVCCGLTSVDFRIR